MPSGDARHDPGHQRRPARPVRRPVETDAPAHGSGMAGKAPTADYTEILRRLFSSGGASPRARTEVATPFSTPLASRSPSPSGSDAWTLSLGCGLRGGEEELGNACCKPFTALVIRAWNAGRSDQTARLCWRIGTRGRDRPAECSWAPLGAPPRQRGGSGAPAGGQPARSGKDP